ncbi:MAG: hypothetical protein AB7H97_08885, partial [Pseudobdellovibrionaceae bacterium]
VDDIPSDYFEEIGDSVYLIRFSQAEISGQLHEMTDGTPHMTGELKPEPSGAFCKMIQRLSEVNGVRSSRVVGSGGLAVTLAKFTGDGVGFSSEGTKSPVWDEDLFQENLYEVVIACDSDEAKTFTTKFEKLKTQFNLTNAELWKIGTTCSDVLQFAGCEVKISEIKQWTENSWRTHFENLA